MSFREVQCAESTVPAFAKSWKYKGRGVNQCHTNQMYCHCSIKCEHIRSDRLPPFLFFVVPLVINAAIQHKYIQGKRNTHTSSAHKLRENQPDPVSAPMLILSSQSFLLKLSVIEEE